MDEQTPKQPTPPSDQPPVDTPKSSVEPTDMPAPDTPPLAPPPPAAEAPAEPMPPLPEPLTWEPAAGAVAATDKTMDEGAAAAAGAAAATGAVIAAGAAAKDASAQAAGSAFGEAPSSAYSYNVAPPNFSGTQMPPVMAPAPKTNTLAIISLVAGILSWVIFPLLGSIVGLITGFMARNAIKSSNGMETGDGLAVAGIIISALNLVLGCLCSCVLFPMMFLPFMFGNGR